LDQLAWHRHAILEPISAARPPLLTGQTHHIETRQWLRRAQIAQMAIHLSLERVERRETRHIERDDEVPGIAGISVVEIEVEHLAAEGCAIERAGEQPENKRKAAAFVAANRQQHALAAPCRIGERLAILGVDHPAFRQGLLLQAM